MQFQHISKMIKKEIYKDREGNETELTIRTLSFRNRNKLFNDYLKLNEFMKDKTTNKELNMLNYIKDDKCILDFMLEILSLGISGLDIDKLEGDEGDELFEKYSKFILTGGGVSEKK